MEAVSLLYQTPKFLPPPVSPLEVWEHGIQGGEHTAQCSPPRCLTPLQSFYNSSTDAVLLTAHKRSRVRNVTKTLASEFPAHPLHHRPQAHTVVFKQSWSFDTDLITHNNIETRACEGQTVVHPMCGCRRLKRVEPILIFKGHLYE